MTGVGASRLQSSGMRPLAASTSAAARENSRPRKRVSWPRITTGLRLKRSDFGLRITELRKSAMPCVARRTLSKVKSRAISPRQPLVPNLMAAIGWFVDGQRSRTAGGGVLNTSPFSPWEGSALPVERLFLEGVNVADEQDSEERNHRAENQIGVLLEHFPIDHRPRIKEHHFDIEENKEHRHQIEPHREPRVPLADRQHAAFVRDVFGFSDLFEPMLVGPFADQNRQDQGTESERERDHGQNQH